MLSQSQIQRATTGAYVGEDEGETVKDLELMAMSWLRFEKRCIVALTERSPRPHHGQPDVLGITKDRYLLEIEVKRSVSDFRANEKKPHIAAHSNALVSEHSAEFWPKQFWYLVPYSLAPKIQGMLPPWAGLLRGPSCDEVQQIYCIAKAQTNKASKRLTTKECVRLAQCMANQIWSQAKTIGFWIKRSEHENWGIDYEI